MDLIRLFEGINLQKEIIDKIIPIINEKENEFNQYIEELIDLNTSYHVYENVIKLYKNDLEILALYLFACIKVYEKYKMIGISDEIFFDTMKCFTRFIDECYVKTNEYNFDRSWWTYRQIRMSEFRIGELEYELDFEENVISIHIPSDANLNKNSIEKSLKSAKEFFTEFYPLCSNWDMVCDSWLLSPKLKLYLSKDSNILLFQEYFNIVKFNENDYGFIEWLFKVNINHNYQSFKEDTSLQRKVKNALLNNEKIGCAFGYLKK